VPDAVDGVFGGDQAHGLAELEAQIPQQLGRNRGEPAAIERRFGLAGPADGMKRPLQPCHVGQILQVRGSGQCCKKLGKPGTVFVEVPA